jgi:outer membrane receptor protein involved in Fe transport
MNKVAKILIGLLFGLMLTALPVFGQADSGTISGTVKDSTGAVMTGARVAVKNLATGAERTAVTGTIGQYQVPGLNPGNYQVTVSIEKFETYRTSTEVTVGGVSTVDAQMTVGQSSAVIEVVGEAATQVNTETHELSQLVNTTQMAQLPSLTRNPYDFVAISGNVSNGDTTSNGATMSNGGGGQELSNRGVGYSINGQRESGTEILLDGVENVAVFSVGIGNNIPIDGVQEYSIVTNNFSAEYGRASGGVVNVTTKSGTNAFHGAAWEFNRLAAYTANTYNNVAMGIPKGQYTRNQFGFSVGGPVIKNKLFASETTEFTRVRSDSSQTEEVFDPSFISLLPANAQAYFAQYGTGVLPSAGVAATVGQINACTTCPNAFTIGAVNGVTALSPNQPVFDTVNFLAPFNDGGGPPTNTYQLVGRVDYNMSDKTQLFFRFARERDDLFAGTTSFSTYPQYNAGSLNQNQSWLLSANHTFSSYLLDNFKASFTRYNAITSFDQALTNSPNLMFVAGEDPVTSGTIQLPGLENANAPGAGGLPFGGPQNTIQLEDDLSWTKGRHNMRFGGQFTYIQLNVAYGAYAQAVEQLGGSSQDSINDLINIAGNPGGSVLSGSSGFSARVDPNGALPCPYDALGNFPAASATAAPDCPASSAVTPPLNSAAYGRSYRYKDWALYAQDSFKFTPRLTLNYGLRYEHYGVQHNNKQNLDSNFYFGAGSNQFEEARNGQVYRTQQSPDGEFWKPQWGTLAPRVGFALDIFGDGKSSLRGGFGISYERNFGNVTYNSSFNPPASAVVQTACAPETGFTVGTYPGCTSAVVTNNDLGPLGLPGPSSFLPPAELRFVDNKIRVAQTQFWSLDLQRELARNTVIDVSYSGAHGVHLYDLNNINLPGQGQVFLGDPLFGTPSYAGEACNPDYATGTACLTRPNSQYAAINERGSNGTSSYNGFNVKFQTQNLHNTGLTLVANYTWAHAIDDTSSTFSDSVQGGSGVGYGSLGYTDPANPKLDWGNADYDVRNRFVVSPIWQTPWYKSEKGIGEALGGWSLVGVFTARTGVPFTVYDISNEWNYYTLPRLTPASAPEFHVSKNPALVAPNTFNLLTVPVPASGAPLNSALGISDFGPFPSGMTARNAFRGPGAWNLDTAVNKEFKLTERFGLTFRAEGFNIFNHHNLYTNTQVLAYFGAPYTPLTVTGLKGGLNTIAEGGNNDERRFGQFSLRLSF